MLRVGSTGTPATPLPSPQKVNGGHEGQALQCDSHSKFPGVLLCFSFSALWLSGCHNPCGLEAEKGVEAGEGGGLFPQPIGAVGGGHVTRCLQAEQRVPRSIFLSCETGAPLPLLATERSAGWGWVWGGRGTDRSLLWVPPMTDCLPCRERPLTRDSRPARSGIKGLD